MPQFAGALNDASASWQFPDATIGDWVLQGAVVERRDATVRIFNAHTATAEVDVLIRNHPLYLAVQDATDGQTPFDYSDGSPYFMKLLLPARTPAIFVGANVVGLRLITNTSGTVVAEAIQ